MIRWIVSIGGAGLLPGAPGTAGSMVAAGVLMVIHAGLRRWLGVEVLPLPVWNGVLAGGVLVFGGLTVALGPWTCRRYGRHDPQVVVLDEAAGVWLTMMFQPQFAGWRQVWAVLAGLAAFRLFDIVKPPPARALERLPGGWGILLDDLAAAVYANLVCQVVLRL